MAVIDYSATNTFPRTENITLSATPDTMQEITVSARATQISVLFSGQAGKVVTNGGADATVITTESYMRVPADTLYYHDLPKSKGSHAVWIAGDVASVVAHFQITERD